MLLNDTNTASFKAHVCSLINLFSVCWINVQQTTLLLHNAMSHQSHLFKLSSLSKCVFSLLVCKDSNRILNKCASPQISFLNICNVTMIAMFDLLSCCELPSVFSNEKSKDRHFPLFTFIMQNHICQTFFHCAFSHAS